ncbi:MAG: hypothetical protein Q8O91_05985 [Candidatus Aminicenantes bacterium]|nr:hypothetical protein [Candidatus Aminicenantes bacterium]
MLSTPEKIVFVLALLTTAVFFFVPLIASYRIVRAGRQENLFDLRGPEQDPVPALHVEERAAVHRHGIFKGVRGRRKIEGPAGRGDEATWRIPPPRALRFSRKGCLVRAV